MEVKHTYITLDQECDHKARENFKHVCTYGTMAPLENEVGSIAKYIGPKIEVWPGFYKYAVEVAERIFVVPDVNIPANVCWC